MQKVASATQAVAELIALYDASCQLAKDTISSGQFERYAGVRYPKLAVDVTKWQPIDRSEPFGYVDEAGVYSAVLSRPDLMQAYLCLLYTSDAADE